MAHFRAVIQGQRGEASRLGSAKTGIDATVDGWHSGVRIRAVVDEAGRDSFEIHSTGGSNGYKSEYIGTLTVDGWVAP